jgi:hypothetical protein
VEQINEPGMGRYYSEAIELDPASYPIHRESPTFNWSEKMPAFAKYWHRKIHGVWGEAKPRLLSWTNGGYPYWVEPDISVYLYGQLLTQGTDYSGRMHNGFVVKRSAFLGVCQFGINVPTFLSTYGFSNLYSREIFEVTRRHNERSQYARMLLGNLNEKEIQGIINVTGLTISPSGDTITYNYKTPGGRVLTRQKRRST